MVSKLRRYRISGTTDADGTFTGTSEVIRGSIKSVSLDIDAFENTALIALSTNADLDVQDIVLLFGSNTNQTLYPRVPAQDIAGTELVYDIGEP